MSGKCTKLFDFVSVPRAVHALPFAQDALGERANGVRFVALGFFLNSS